MAGLSVMPVPWASCWGSWLMFSTAVSRDVFSYSGVGAFDMEDPEFLDVDCADYSFRDEVLVQAGHELLAGCAARGDAAGIWKYRHASEDVMVSLELGAAHGKPKLDTQFPKQAPFRRCNSEPC